MGYRGVQRMVTTGALTEGRGEARASVWSHSNAWKNALS